MALYSKTTGNWSTLGTFNTQANGLGADQVPTSADDCTVQSGHTVTLDTTGLVANGCTVASGGTLNNTTSANWDFTLYGNGSTMQNLFVAASTTAFLNLDMSGASAYTGTITLNQDAKTDTVSGYAGRGIVVSGKMTLKGASVSRNTTLTANQVSGTNTATVASATGWLPGKRVILSSTSAYDGTVKTDNMILDASYTPGSTSLIFTANTSYNHASGSEVGYFSSNLTIQGSSNSVLSFLISGAGGSSYTKTVDNVLFSNMAGSTTFGVGSFNVLSSGGLGWTGFTNSAFYEHARYAFYANGTQGSPYFSNIVCYSSTNTAHTTFEINQGNFQFGNVDTLQIYRSAYGGVLIGGPGLVFNNPLISCCASTRIGIKSGFTDTVVNGGSIRSNDRAIDTGASATYLTLNNTDIGNLYGATNGVVCQVATLIQTTFNDCNVQSTNTIGATGSSWATLPSAGYVAFVNKNTNPANQEIWTPTSYSNPTFSRDTASGMTRSTSAVKMRLDTTATTISKTFKVLAKNGVPMTTCVALKMDDNTKFSTKPSITISGLGITPVTHSTMASNNNWQEFVLTATQSSGADGELTITLSAVASSATICYFSGMVALPFVTSARWYGYIFDETNPVRTINPTVSASEATALAYTDFTLTGGVSNTSTQVTANSNVQKLYDYGQAKSCSDATWQTYKPPLIGSGNANAAAMSAQGDITVDTTRVLTTGGNILTLSDSNTVTTGSMALASTSSTITRASGSFVTDGFVAGDIVALSGFATSTNNTQWVVTNVAALTLTLDGVLTADTSASGRTVVRKTNIITEFAGAVAYTYGGGKWTQATTVPTFDGGLVKIGASGTYVFTTASSTILSLTPTGASTYDMSGTTITGTLDLRNTTAHAITVQLPVGTSTTTANNSGGTITVSTPSTTRGLYFTGLIAGSTLKVYDTGTTTERFSDTNTSTTETWSEGTAGSVTVDYTICKNGYLPIRVTGITVTGAISGGVITTPIQQAIDNAYSASSGLTLGVNVTIDPTTGFTLSAASTLQNFYSFVIEQYTSVAQADLKNKAFPMSPFGSSSFDILGGRTFTDGATSIAYLTNDGMRYLNSSGNPTAVWAAFASVGVPTGEQARYQQTDAGTTVNTENTGNFNQLIQIMSDPNGDGNYADGYDYRGWMVFKVQADGYDQSEVNVLSMYNIAAMEATLYTVPLTPTSNGLATGNPALTTAPTISQGTYVYESKTFSVKIVDGATPNTGTGIQRWLRYNFELGGTFQGEDAFNWHDLVQTNGSNFKTVRGTVYGTATTKGVIVYMNDGTTIHPDFDLFTADDGTTYSPPVVADVSITGMPNAGAVPTRLQIINTTASTASIWQASTAYAVGDVVLRTAGVGSESTAGLYMRCTTAGTSHTVEPTWDTTVGNTTTEGGVSTVVWTTYAVLFYDADPASTSYVTTYTEGNQFKSGETVTVRFAEMDGATSFKTYSANTIASSAGFSFVVDETVDDVYATNAIDGSAYEGTFSPNFIDDYIVLDTNTDFSGVSAYAYFCYTLTTSNGMYEFWGGVTALDTGNYRIETDILDLYFDVSVGFVKQTDNVRIFRKDGVRPALDPVTASGGGIEINWKTPVSAYPVASALTAGQDATLTAINNKIGTPVATVSTDIASVKTDTKAIKNEVL